LFGGKRFFNPTLSKIGLKWSKIKRAKLKAYVGFKNLLLER